MYAGPSNSLSGIHNKAQDVLPLRIRSCFIRRQLVSILSSCKRFHSCMRDPPTRYQEYTTKLRMSCLCGFVHALFVASWCQYSLHVSGFIHVCGTLQLVIRHTQQSSGCLASADSFMLYSSPVGVNTLF